MTLSTAIVGSTQQDGTSVANSNHADVHVTLHGVHNNTIPNGVWTQGTGIGSDVGDLFHLLHGSSSAKVAAQGYSFFVSREMNVSTAGDSNAAIYGAARNSGSTQPVGVKGYAVATGTSDACAGYFVADQQGSGAAYAGFFDATWGASAKANYAAFGVNPVMLNASNLDWDYDGATTVGPSGVFIQCVPYGTTAGAKKSGTGITITTLGGDATKALFAVGIAFWPGSIKTAAIRADDSAITFADVRGTRTGYGIDYANGTFALGYERFAPNHLITQSSGDPIYLYDALDFFLYARASNTHAWYVGGNLVGAFGPTPSAGSTNLTVIDSAGTTHLVQLQTVGGVANVLTF